jgi:UDP-N-acetylmuramate--alanine ligase
MYNKLNIHFVGIGGIGMSGIAEILLNLGYPVSGSDIKRSAITNRLKRLGAHIHIGHRAAHVGPADVVVVSSAVQANNPEVVVARKKGIRVIQRAEMLSEIMRLAKYGIAVAGTHGKTTTTSLLATILETGHVDPTVIIGGRLRSLRSNAKLGRGDFMVTEADESDGSFLKLYPTIAIVTNIDREHLDHYQTFKNCREAFAKFCHYVPFHGLAILCGEHAETLALSKKLDKRVALYGFSHEHDWNAQNIDYRGTMSHYHLHHKDTFVDAIEVNLSGRHNVLNSLAAIAAAREIGVPLSAIKKALKNFGGVGRRMEVLYKGHEIVVLDDYGHHPAEIKATLETVRRAFVGRLVVLFQPHRYSRTKDLFTEFIKSFGSVDRLFITDIYAASEKPIKGVNSQRLVKAIEKKGMGDGRWGTVTYLPRIQKIEEKILSELRVGDVFVSLGAGDVTHIGRRIAKALKKKFK